MTSPVERLFLENRQKLISASWRILRSHDDAQDVCQEAFSRLLQTTDPIEEPKAWLYRTAINLSIDRVRRKKPCSTLEPESSPATTGAKRTELLDRALQELPERQRVVFLLRHEEGMPLVEIARILGVAPSTIGVHLTRALRTLWTKLAPYLEDLR